MISLIISVICFYYIDTDPVTFRLIDSETGDGISYAHIFFEGDSNLVVSSSDGYFNSSLQANIGKIRISHLNYGVQDILLSKDILESQTFIIKSNYLELEEIEINESFDRITLEKLTTKLKNLKIDSDKLYAISLQEFVETNQEFEKFADGVGVISWDEKNNLIGNIAQCRVVALPNEIDAYLEIVNPIPHSVLFEGLKSHFFINLAKKLETSTDYKITIRDNFTELNFTKSSKEDQYLTHYTLLFDGEDKLIQFDFEMSNPSNLVKNLVIMKATLNSIKGIYIFAPSSIPTLTFSRLESEISIEFKGQIQENKFVSQSNIIGIKGDSTSKLSKKELEKPLHKICKGYTTEFWKESNMPIFSQSEYEKVMLLLNP